MPFQIIRNDIANMRADAIVNTANPKPVIGAGTDAAIHKKAKLVSSTPVAPLSHRHTTWVPNMLFIPLVPFGKAATGERKLCSAAVMKTP